MAAGLMIGNVVVDPPLILAPMAGITNHAFRLVCKEAGGCGLVSGEMVSAHALRYCHKKTKAMLDWTDDERPVSAQVFGSKVDMVADGAKIIEEACPDLIEINMGCPAPKVVKSGSGSALLKDLKKAEEMIAAVVRAVKVPVTVKTRKGWGADAETAVEVARIAEANGCAAVTVHGRTATQKFTGEADWETIRRVKEAVSIPVIGNGDVRKPESARRMFDETGCDGVMIGRATLGDPWIFHRIHVYLTTGVIPPEPDFLTKIEGARRHARLLAVRVGEKRASNEMRGHIAMYLKGAPGAAAIRAKLMVTKSIAEIEEVLDEARSKCEFGIIEGR